MEPHEEDAFVIAIDDWRAAEARYATAREVADKALAERDAAKNVAAAAMEILRRRLREYASPHASPLRMEDL